MLQLQLRLQRRRRGAFGRCAPRPGEWRWGGAQAEEEKEEREREEEEEEGAAEWVILGLGPGTPGARGLCAGEREVGAAGGRWADGRLQAPATSGFS